MKAPSINKDPQAHRGLDRWVSVGIPAMFVVAGVAVYVNGLPGPFIFDDISGIVENEHIRGLWPLSRSLTAPQDTPGAGRPLLSLSLALSYSASGLEPRGYRVFNLGLHLLCGLVLFGVIRRTLESNALKERFGRSARRLAFYATLVWLLHPVHSECINYVSQRSELLFGLLYLLTLYCSIRGHQSRRALLWTIGSIVCCAAGMASKEAMVTAPAIVVLYDAVFNYRSLGSALRHRWKLYSWLAASWVLLGALMLQGARAGSVGFGHGCPASLYAMNQCIMIVTYLRRVVWPHPLVADYGCPKPVSLEEIGPYALVVVLAVVATAVLLLRRPAVGFCAAWFFVILSPTSSFVPIVSEVGAERRLYLPSAGLIALIIVAGSCLLRRAVRWVRAGREVSRCADGPTRLLVTVESLAIAIACGAFGWLIIERNKDYLDEFVLWKTVVDACPDNIRARLNFGIILNRREQFEEAGEHFRRAIAISASNAEPFYHLGVALTGTGRVPEAMQAYRRALAIRPDYADAHFNLAYLLLLAGDDDAALNHFAQAVRARPDFPEARYNLAMLLKRTGKLREALSQLTETMRLRPDWADVFGEAAWILATHPDPSVRNPAEAVRLSQRALQLEPRPNAIMLEQVAAAYAAAGRFEQAVAYSQQALKVARERGPIDLIKGIEKRLGLYRNGRTLVDLREDRAAAASGGD